MKLTKSQKISFAVLAVAVGAFVVDQFTGGGDCVERQVAQVLPTMVSLGTAAGQVPAAPAGDDVPLGFETATATALQRLAAEPVVSPRDAFAPSAAWLPPAVTPDKARESAAAFVRNHKLKAIVYGDGVSRAMIDGDLFCVGQTINGFNLVAINTTSVRFCNGALTIDLPIDGVALSASGNESIGGNRP